MIKFHAAEAVIYGRLPAKFQGLVGVYPQDIFRPRSLHTVPLAGVSLFVHGQRVACDGSSYELESLALSLGDFLALDVTSELDAPVFFQVTFRGLSGCIDGEVARGMKLGAKIARPGEELQSPWQA